MYYYLFSYMMFNVRIVFIMYSIINVAQYLDGKVNIVVYKLVSILSLKRHLSGLGDDGDLVALV